MVARFGGEEWWWSCRIPGWKGACGVAERICQRIESEPFSIHQGTRAIPVTVSIGVATRVLEDLHARGDPLSAPTSPSTGEGSGPKPRRLLGRLRGGLRGRVGAAY